MTETDARLALGDDERVAPPTASGELVFEAPWQARVFGIAHALCDAGLFTWDEFRAALIEEIGRWDRANPDGGDYAYFDRFQAALEMITNDRGIAGSDALRNVAVALAARPHGHDH